MEPLQDRFAGFGLALAQGDGHDWTTLEREIGHAGRRGPRIVVLETVKGKGVSFMEDRMEWHYLPMNRAQYEQATREIEEL